MFEKITKYTVCAISPEVSDEWYNWIIDVTWRGDDLWSVDHFGDNYCLNSDDEWVYQRCPDGIDYNEWRKTHRFTLPTALKKAHDWAPLVTVNGLTPTDIIIKHAANGS